MQTIMRDYLYIKSFLRNTLNHASDRNDCTREELAYYQANGCPITKTVTLPEIVSVMRRAVQHCKEGKT